MVSDAVTPQPDAPQPNEQEKVDLDPQIESEPAEEKANAEESDPTAVNTLIDPENS